MNLAIMNMLLKGTLSDKIEKILESKNIENNNVILIIYVNEDVYNLEFENIVEILRKRNALILYSFIKAKNRKKEKRISMLVEKKFNYL